MAEQYSIPNCVLEVHRDRGVIYVHGPTGATLLRIERLPTPIPNVLEEDKDFPRMLDIAHMESADWGKK